MCSGYGALFGNSWFACTWTVEEEQQAARDKRDSMPFKELYALTLAATTWGDHNGKVERFCFILTVNLMSMLGEKAIHENHKSVISFAHYCFLLQHTIST